MQIRTSKPEAGNKFYTTKGWGGYSICIQGYPTDPYCNVLSNCVGYACGRFNEIIGSMQYPTLSCNAENFIERAQGLGLEIGQIPKPGAIMVWQVGTLSSSDGAGHVAIVEKVIDNNTVYTSESSYGGTAFFNTTRYKSANGRWGYNSAYFRGFIYNPAIKEEEISVGLADELSKYTDEELADMVLAGKFGNGNERKISLGDRYAAVQKTVNQKLLKPTVTLKESKVVAQEVLDGKWGNGEDRKRRLTEAGYDYNEIQSLVNQLLTAPIAQTGSRIRVKTGARDLNTNGLYAGFVYLNTYIIKQIQGNRVVFGTSNVTIGAVDKSNIILV